MRVILEVGDCNGSYEYAEEAAHAIGPEPGVWGYKAQIYRHDEVFSRAAQRFDGQTGTQWDAVAQPIPRHQWAEIKSICDGYGKEFLASVFDHDAVYLLEDMGVNYWKVASGDITYRSLLEHVGSLGQHIFLSTGASTLAEIRNALDWVGHSRVTLMACTLCYPAPVAEAHLGRIRTLKRFFPAFEVGYSDHTFEALTPALAAAHGASVVEKHFTLEPGGGGDHSFAVDLTRLRRMVKFIEQAELSAGDPRLRPVPAEGAALIGARRSWAVKHHVPINAVLRSTDLVFVRPGTEMQLDSPVGKTTNVEFVGPYPQLIKPTWVRDA
jgi:sialic acid synthase SpsE